MNRRYIIPGVACFLALATATLAQPSPIYTLSPSTNFWDGRQTFTVTPNISNLAALQAAGAANFNYRWTVDGVAVIGQTMPPDILNPGIFTTSTLTLVRSQGNGQMTVTLALDNGGTPVTNICTIAVQQPASDPWVQRVPGPTEQPVNGQFYARDNTGYGTIYYNGSLGGSPDYVFCNVYSNGVLYTNLTQTLSGGNYAFAARIKGGLVTYSVTFGSVTGTTTNTLNTVTNLVCGDAYIIEGQSNAEATAPGSEGANVYTNYWIRSYGTMDSPPGTTNGGWGYATRADAEPRIGYWGMDLASNLWAAYNIPICIINGAVGGTMIMQHEPNLANHYAAGPTGDMIYANLLNRVVAAGLTHGIRGVLWHQAEQNQGDSEGLAYGLSVLDYVVYQKHFVNLSAAWKQDFPNIQDYYIYQIYPAACGGEEWQGCEMIREVERTLPRLYSHMGIMSTLWNSEGGWCHYAPDGYQALANVMTPLVKQDNYGYVPPSDPSAANLVQAYYTTTSRNEIALVFNQNMNWANPWGSPALNQFFMDYVDVTHIGTYGVVTSGSASGNVIKLKLSGTSNYKTITYILGNWWAIGDSNHQIAWNNSTNNLLYGSNGVAALTFCSVPIQTYTPQTPTQLGFTAVPANNVIGLPFSVTVAAVDGSGNPQNVTSNTTVQLSANSGSGTLSGATMGVIASGSSTVTLSGVTYSGTDTMTLKAMATSGTSLGAGISSSITFMPPPPSTQLRFAVSPVNGWAGFPLSVVVAAEDASGSLQNVTNATTVQLSLNSGSGVLSGTTSGTIASGSSSVAISGFYYSAGDTMTLKATASSGMALGSVTSAPITFAVSTVGYTTATNGGNVIVTFTNGTGGWAVPAGVSVVQALVVGGGGGGGAHRAGGGGGGGVLYSSGVAVSGSVPVSVGTGGAGAVYAGANGPGNGGNSTFVTLTAIGGGAGASQWNSGASRAGGSAGSSGGGASYDGGGVGYGTVGQGNNGGTYYDYNGGGGGGAGAVGGIGAFGNGQAGAGGAGINNSITGIAVAYGGGGGGGANDGDYYCPKWNARGGAGGAGGGGKGGDNSCTGTPAAAGAANTGGGGGGGSGGLVNGAAGGSGVVIISYAQPVAAVMIQNTPAAAITTNSAVLNAALSCGSTNASVSAYWGTVNGGTNAAQWANSAYVGAWTNVASTNLSYTANGLAPNTPYYFTYCGTNGGGSVWSANVLTFTTMGPPLVGNAAGAGNLVAGVAQLQGTLTNGPADVRFYWGAADGGTTPGNWSSMNLLTGVPTGSFSSTASNLFYGLIYYYRCCASNQWGVAWSPATASFTTLKPVVAAAVQIPYSNLVEVSASSQYGGYPATNAFNGAGLQANGTHTTSGNWFSSGTAAVSSEWLKVRFDQSYVLDHLRVWAFNGGMVTPGVTNADVYVINSATDPAGNVNLGGGPLKTNGWSLLLPQQYFTPSASVATETNTDPGISLGGVLARQLALKINKVVSGNYAGFAEVQIYQSPPVLTLNNLAASGVGSASATLNAALGCTGAVYQVYAYWNTLSGGTNAALWTNSAYVGSWTNIGSASLSYTATGLAPSTAYYFTFCATNVVDTLWAGNVQSFTTLAPAIPPTPVLPVSGIAITSGVPSFTFTAAAGCRYRLDYKDILTDAGWSYGPWSTNTSGGPIQMTLTDPSAVAQQQRFYRLEATGH